MINILLVFLIMLLLLTLISNIILHIIIKKTHLFLLGEIYGSELKCDYYFAVSFTSKKFENICNWISENRDVSIVMVISAPSWFIENCKNQHENVTFISVENYKYLPIEMIKKGVAIQNLENEFKVVNISAFY